MNRQPGAIKQADGKTRFSVWAPSIDRMTLVLDGADHAMRREDDGWFITETDAPPGCRYQFRTGDGLIFPDPASRAQAGDVHDCSVVTDSAAYKWRNRAWNNRPWHEAVIYEVHAGLMGGFNGVRAQLADIAASGITVLELMPIADFPGKRNWGYDGVLHYAPDAAYGTPVDLKALVDEAHGHNLMVMLDVVYNHFGPDGAYIHAIAREFFDPDIHTPWGAAIDFTRPEVQSYFLGNALMWLNEYRFDGLRFDAVHAIKPTEILPQLARMIRSGAERPVHLVLENADNQASLLNPGSGGQDKFDAQWSDDFHNTLHVLLTGELEGYYEDFSNPTDRLVRVLSEGFAYQGETPPNFGKPRGEASGHLPPEAFVAFLQNHDQTGNRAMGERLTTLVKPEALRAATALLLLCPFIPLLFMGEDWGTEAPFLFFTDHNDELAGLVREGRRKEFQHFRAFQDEEQRDKIPDPNALSTFEACRVDPEERRQPKYKAIYDQTRHLLSLRAKHVAPGIPGAKSAGANKLGPKAVRAAWRLGNGGRLIIESNFGSEAVATDAQTAAPLYVSGDANDGHLGPYTTRVFLLPEA